MSIAPAAPQFSSIPDKAKLVPVGRRAREATNYPCRPPRFPAWLWSIRSRSRAAVLHGQPGAADPKDLITCIDGDIPAAHDQEGERLFDDAG